MSLQFCIEFKWLLFICDGTKQRRHQADDATTPVVEVLLDIVSIQATVDEMLLQGFAHVRMARCRRHVGQNVGEVGSAACVPQDFIVLGHVRS